MNFVSESNVDPSDEDVENEARRRRDEEMDRLNLIIIDLDQQDAEKRNIEAVEDSRSDLWPD